MITITGQQSFGNIDKTYVVLFPVVIIFCFIYNIQKVITFLCNQKDLFFENLNMVNSSIRFCSINVNKFCYVCSCFIITK